MHNPSFLATFGEMLNPGAPVSIALGTVSEPRYDLMLRTGAHIKHEHGKNSNHQ